MRLCVISDIHTRHRVAEEIITKERFNVDKFIFLGDYFDDYEDNIEINEYTAEFLQNYLHNDQFIFLIGNHDLHYIFNLPQIRCHDSYREDKNRAINNILTGEDWDKLHWTYTIDNWLFSHSGINFDGVFTSKKYDEILNLELESILNEGKDAEYLKYPDGKFWVKTINQPVYAEKEPGVPYNQMFGHTILFNWDMKTYVNYKTYNIDTHNQHYAIIDTSNNHVDILKSGYYHRYYRKEIQWLIKTNQLINS